MYNVVRTSELRARGVQSRCIREAIGCCLLALTQGMYSVVAHCSNPRHSAIAEFVTDEAWITRVAEQTDQETGQLRFELLDMFEKLRVASYPHYRVDDVIWGVSAGFVHDFQLYRPPRGKVFIAHPTRRHSSADVVRTSKSVPEADVVRIGKMSLTSPIRTAFDLIGQLGEPEGFAALETCLRRSVFGSDAGADEAARFGYPPDTQALAERRIAEDFMPVLLRLSKGQSRAQRLLSAVGPLSELRRESLQVQPCTAETDWIQTADKDLGRARIPHPCGFSAQGVEDDRLPTASPNMPTRSSAGAEGSPSVQPAAGAGVSNRRLNFNK